MTFNQMPERMFTQHQLHGRINDERRRARHVVRFIWAMAMFLATPFALGMHMQKLIEFSWYWPAIIGVRVNALCWWISSKIWFSKVR